MPVTERWMDESRNTMVIEITDPWTWDDYFAGFQRSRELREAVDMRGNVIVDFSGTRGVPGAPITRLPQMAESYSRVRGLVILVGVESVLGRLAADIFARVYGHVHNVRTMAQAMALLKQEAGREDNGGTEKRDDQEDRSAA